MRVEYIEYVRPYGRQKKFDIELSNEVKDAHDAMLKAGGRLTVEHLPNNTINICIEKPGVCDYKTLIVQNHIRHVAAGFKAMLQEFDASEFEEVGE